MRIRHFKFHESGLNRFFGPLEAEIMNIIWDGLDMTIKDVQTRLEHEKPISFNTVMTVMNRLVDKGILDKQSNGRSFIYRPTSTRDEFFETQSMALSQDLLAEFGPVVVSHMLDALDDVDPDLLDQLEQKLKDLKKDRT